MNNLQIFKNEEFGEIRTLEINDEPWFCLRDVCRILQISNSSQAKKRLDQKGVINNEVLTNGGRQSVFFVSESNLYKLIMQSRKPQAEAFSDWVTGEILPSIRKTGVYMTDAKAYDITHNPQSLADLLLQAGEQLKQKELIIQEMAPKALFADSVASSNDSILVGQLAKLIKQNGRDIGQNRLFALLREDGFLCKSGENRNLPTQKAMEMGLFEVKERTVNNPDGSVRITKTTKVTGKGQIYFVKKYIR